MDEQDLVRLYAQGSSRGSAARANCPEPEALLAAVERTGSEEERARTIDHATSCAGCGEELELLQSSRIVRERPQLPRIGLAIAASVMVAVGLGYYAMKRGQFPAAARDLIRGDGDVVLVSPAKDESGPLRVLTWHRVSGALGYTVEVRHDDGTVVLRSDATDTVFAVSDSIAAATTGTIYWGVTATLSDGSERRSATRRLRAP
jgi:hypothetical protein